MPFSCRARSPSGTIAGFDLGRRARGARRAGDPDPGQRAARCSAAPKREPDRDRGRSRAPLLQDGDIYYNGQHIALVVADTLERAQHAAALVEVAYREDEAQIRMEDALGEAYPPKHFRNGARPPDSRRGDPEAALRGGAGQARRRPTRPRSRTTTRWSRTRRSRCGRATATSAADGLQRDPGHQRHAATRWRRCSASSRSRSG